MVQQHEVVHVIYCQSFRIAHETFSINNRTFHRILITLAGCHLAQHTEYFNKKIQINWKRSLINDIQDGRLDMPFDRACFIASGVNTDKNAVVSDKDQHPSSRINQETNANNTTDLLTKAQFIFDWLQRNANEGTYNDCYDIRDTLQPQGR